jgi:hypothetical protein
LTKMEIFNLFPQFVSIGQSFFLLSQINIADVIQRAAFSPVALIARNLICHKKKLYTRRKSCRWRVCVCESLGLIFQQKRLSAGKFD